MTNQRTKVRESHDYSGLKWIVDIPGELTIGKGFVQPDGTKGRLHLYDTQATAETAEALFAKLNLTCSECKNFESATLEGCEKSLQLIATNPPVDDCRGFKPKSSAVKRELVLHPAGKMTNPKDIIGVKKTPLSALSGPVLYEMALGMLEGARKYGRHNYRAMGVSATVYYDAAAGHLLDWFEGEDFDPDTGLSHVTKALTALLVLRDSMLMGNWTDDRPIRNPNKLYKKHFNVKAKEIIEKLPDSKAPYLETDPEDRKCGKTL